MNKTIKVIDLLNKIANGEKPPKKIKHLKQIYMLYENYEDTGLVRYDNDEDFLVLDLVNCLNDEVEIIEEEPEIDIQRIEELGSYNIRKETQIEDLAKTILDLGVRINDLVQAVKQLDNKINNK